MSIVQISIGFVLEENQEMGLSSFFHSVAVVLLVAAIFTVQLGLVTAGMFGYFLKFTV